MNLKQMKIPTLLLGFVLLLGTLPAYAALGQQPQTINVTGTVVYPNGDPVIGASVLIAGDRTRSTVTDLDGHFSLQNVPADGTLNFSFVGMKSLAVQLNGRTVLNITMEEDSALLDEVVVVGFGAQKKQNLTAAVSTVDTKSLDSRPVTTLGEALQGTVPGLNLTTSSYGGQLGATMSVDIRGTGTISTGSYSSVLVLIDGIEGNMNNLNPNDIASISVLKDAAASAVYGSRAAFGVILITTKTGESGRIKVNYSNNFRYSGPTKLPNMADSYTFANYFNESSINGGGSAIFNDETLNRIQQYINGEITTTTVENTGNGNWQFHEKANDNVNWYKVHFQWAWAQEHNVNISGGSDNIRYYASANYLDQNGNLTYGNDTYKRLNTMAKVNAKIGKYVDFNINAKYINYTLDNPLYSDLGGLLYHDILRMWPTMPYKDPNGYYMRNGKLNQLTNGSRSVTDNGNLYGQAQLVIHPAKGWNITAEAGARIINQTNNRNLNKVYEHNVAGVPLLLAYGSSYVSGQTMAQYTYMNSNQFTYSVYSDYEWSKNNHNLKAMVGMNAENYYYRTLGARRDDLITEAVPEISAATGDDQITASNVYEWATAGFFGRLNYDYKEKYLFEASARYDGSSRFLSKDRWGFFPSVSLGWNIAKEGFFKGAADALQMNVLKLRGTWGSLGNQYTNSIYPMYLTQSVSAGTGSWLMNGANPNVSSVPGAISSSLTWETVKTINVGLDIAMLDNRLNATAEYYIRTTENMVGPASEIAAVFGTSMPSTNNATLRNNGWELAINWRDQVGAFKYNVGFNLSDYKVTVMKYPNASKSLSTYYEGQVLGQIWGYETEGIAKSKGEMDAWLANNKPTWGSNWGEGDIMYRDLNGDGIINTGSNTLEDSGDRRVIGNSTPRFRFGFSLGMEWKGFDFSMFLQGVMKRDIWLSGPYYWGAGSGEWQMTVFTDHLDYYREESTSSVLGANTDAYFPRIYMSKSMNQQVQTRYLQNGAYLRLKNLQLGYTFPDRWMRKIHVEKLRIFASGENLWTLTSLPDAYDPEATDSAYSGSGTGKTYPLSTTVSFGLNITF